MTKVIQSVNFTLEDPLPNFLNSAKVNQNDEPYKDETYSLSLAVKLGYENVKLKRIFFRTRGVIIEKIRLDEQSQQATNSDLPITFKHGSLAFTIQLNLICAPANTTIEILAQSTTETAEVFATVQVIRKSLDIVNPHVYTPILLDAGTSCGTTYFMRLLGAHPQIAFHNRYPFEFCLASYWFYLLEALSSLVVPGRSFKKNMPRDIRMTSRHVPTPPYYGNGHVPGGKSLRYIGRNYIEKLANFCVENVDAFYALHDNDENRAPLIRYFIEKRSKMPNINPLLVQELYPDAKRIFLFRDVRDKICSTMARRKRSRTSIDPETIATKACQKFNNRYDLYEMNCDESLLVKYEDLVANTDSSAKLVFEHLGINAGADQIQRIIDEANSSNESMTKHRTSKSALESIGRYRNDLPKNSLDICESICGETLNKLGYKIQ